MSLMQVITKFYQRKLSISLFLRISLHVSNLTYVITIKVSGNNYFFNLATIVSVLP